jgi:D-arabinose 1-dehydrogenase-like Zn-dependent alcohol dehydrogenase
MQTSRVVVLTAFNEPLTIDELRRPAVTEGAALVSIEYGGICGTDVHLQKGGLPVPTPLVLGHEGVGRIEVLGEGLIEDYFGIPLQGGDRVVWTSNIPCGVCFYCVQLGERTLCQTRLVYGINQPLTNWPGLSGSWADAIYLQPGTTIMRIPDDIPSQWNELCLRLASRSHGRSTRCGTSRTGSGYIREAAWSSDGDSAGGAL